MKRKITLAISLAFATTFSANIMAEETGAGCGVGKMVMEGKEGKNANISAALINIAVNYFTGAQLFGMTSGTLGCDVTQEVKNEHERETFFARNEDNITIEMAQGEGAHLKSLASLMGIENQDQDIFFSHLQTNYENIVTSDNMLASIDTSLLDHPTLNKYVQ